MNVGDLINFMSIGAGKTDKPPYSQDGEWRTGLIVDKVIDNKLFSGRTEFAHVFYRGEIIRVIVDNCRLIREANENR